MKLPKRGSEQGFTIVELLVATAIFSIVTLVALSSFVGIGRLFYKGVVFGQNQQTIRDVTDHVNSDINQASNISPLNVLSGGYRYYCFDNIRYSFQLGHITNTALEDSEQSDSSIQPYQRREFSLLRDKVNGNISCPSPFDSTNGLSATANELLGNRMRLNSFCIVQNTVVKPSDIYKVTLSLVTADAKAINTNPSSAPGGCEADQVASCKPGLSVSQFCAQNQLSTAATSVNTSQVEGPATAPGAITYNLTVNATGGPGSFYIDGSLCGGTGAPCVKTYTLEAKESYPTVVVEAAANDPTNHPFVKWTSLPSTCDNSQETCTFILKSNTGMTAKFQ